MPAYMMAEEAAAPDEGIVVEVIPVEPAENDPEEPGNEAAGESAAGEPALDSETGDPDRDSGEPDADPETAVDEPVGETRETEVPVEETNTPGSEASLPEEESAESEELPAEDLPDLEEQEETAPVDQPEVETGETEPGVSSDTAEEPEDNRSPLQEAIDTYGHVYALTVRKTSVYSSPVMKADTLVFTTDDDMFPLLATKYTEHGTVVVWFLDKDGNVVKGFVDIKNLDEAFLLDEDAANSYDMPYGEGMTSIGQMKLFIVDGTYPVSEEATLTPETAAETETDSEMAEADDVETQDTSVSDETPVSDILFVEPEKDVEDIEDDPVSTDVTVEEPPAEEEILPEDAGETGDSPEQEAVVPMHTEGDYVSVTTKARVFGSIDPTASETYYSSGYQGNFVKDATVQIQSASIDDNGTVWYQVRYLYGDDFANGRMKWTRYGTVWVLESETGETAGDACTVTDYAYTAEYLKTIRSTRRLLRSSTPMTGFTLKDANASIGSFEAFVSGLYGSSGSDDYPQIAASTSHGTIYATPHYLEGYTVYCLEHKLPGPGEGSGSSQTAKGPYVLVDMDAFVNDPDYGGTTGVQFGADTMHALAWVLRHTYPFMVLDRDDSYNETWSRVAGQFAMREVIKQLEGAQYVRDYWDMDNFYSLRAPEVYLTYARWLAENGIARSGITGDIAASNQSVIISGSNYIGTVTLTTDADLIRIPRTAGTISGNSGGSDNSYYYVKSGDTIRITSSESEFTVSMESISSDTEEANFLVGVPSVAIQKLMVPLNGSPYPLKSGSLTFELSEGSILVTKESTDGTLLEGAVFELLDNSGAVIATASTGAAGTAVFTGIQPGTYTVREKTAPQGYRLAVSASESVSVTAGSQAEVTFVNEPIMARLRIVKTDTLTEKPLPGVVFTVTRLSGSGNGTIAAVVTTNEQGIAETDVLPAGEYRIDETTVLEGYIDSGYTTTVLIK